MYHIIINPKSRTGKGYSVWKLVQKELEQKEIPYEAYFTHYEFHAIKITKKICENNTGTKHIIVVGGDGTVNEVLNGISNYAEIILGYIPSGSSNDLARSLGISKDPIKALNGILLGKKYRYIDTGEVILPNKEERKKFAVSCGIGFDAAVCYEALNSNLKKLLNKIKLGKLTYVMIAIKQLIRYKPINGVLIIDNDKEYPLKNIFFIASLIHKYEGGGVNMAPKANPYDGKLSVCAIYDIPKIKGLVLFPALFLGKGHLFGGVKNFVCTSLEIRTDEKTIVHTDGEFTGRLDHIHISCKDKKIRIVL